MIILQLDSTEYRAMTNRRQRLEFALGILPYHPSAVQLTAAQKQVESIIARLGTGDTSEEDESDDEKTNRSIAVGFAEHTMQQILKSDPSNKFWNELHINPAKMERKMATLTQTAQQMSKIRRKLQEELQGPEKQFGNNVEIIEADVALADAERKQLVEINLKMLNEARLKLLQHWERCKRKALNLLTFEIDKLQAMDQLDAQNSTRFEMFRSGTEEHNTSTPKSNDDDDDAAFNDNDDEEYKPASEDMGAGKRKRKQLPVTSTPQAKRACLEFEFDVDPMSPMVIIGPNGTKISRDSLSRINWKLSGSAITRKLLCEIFDRESLATYTLSGKPSPAFKDCPSRPTKQPLDPLKVADLEHLMTRRMDMTVREVRTAITTKCADENKMLRSRLQRLSRLSRQSNIF